MSLVVGTVILVSGITAVVAVLGYALDRSTARQERKE